MKRLLLSLNLILVFSAMFSTDASAQSAGFNETFLVLRVNNSGDLYYDLNANTANFDFNNANLGTFCQGSTTGITFKGAEHNVYKCNGCDLQSTRIYYRVYVTGTTPGAFVSNPITYESGFANGCSGQDQKWRKVDYNTNVLAGLAGGNYTMEVYSDATVTCAGGVVYAGNSGANYKATFTVNSTSVGGTVTGAQAICAGSTPTNLTLNGFTGNITKWQKSSVSDFSSNVTDIANTSSTLSGTQIGALSATTYFRAVVTSGVCSSANSSSVAVTVSPQTIGGTIAGEYQFCNSTNSGTLTLSAYTGTIVKWQSAPVSDFSSGVTDIANITAIQSFNNLTGTVYYRAIVKSGVCAVMPSSVKAVVVNPNTWLGITTNWNDPANWCGGVPSATDVVSIGTATNLPVIQPGMTLTAGNLTITDNSVVTIVSGSSLQVTNGVTVNAGSSLVFQNNANLIQSGAANGNSGNIIVHRNSSLLFRQDYTLWSSPVAGQEIQDFSEHTVIGRFYTYNPVTDFYEAMFTNLQASNGINFERGKGYLIRMPNGHPAQGYVEGTTAINFDGKFTGVPYSGDIAVPLTAGAQGFNAIGNPYPSPISIPAFFAANPGLNGTIYFWRKTNGANASAYATATADPLDYVPAGSGSENPNGIIQAGQGFIVKTNGTTTANFNNAMRSSSVAHDYSFFRMNASNAQPEGHRIRLKLSNTAGAIGQMLVGYKSNATMGIDDGVDAKYINDVETSLNSMISEEAYVIQGRSLPFDVQDVVPLQFKAGDAGQFTIAIEYIDGLFVEGQAVYLRDKLTGTEQNLQEGAYNFSTEAGTFNDRFEIVYAQALGTGDNALMSDGAIVYKQGNSIVITTGTVQMTGVMVFDMQGRKIYTAGDINASEFSVNNLQSQQQVLIVQVATPQGKFSRKIVF